MHCEKLGYKYEDKAVLVSSIARTALFNLGVVTPCKVT